MADREKAYSRIAGIFVFALAAGLVFAAASGPARAMPTVTVDGILTSGEYSGGSSHGMKSIVWWNDHHSIYTQAAANMNPLLWEINDTGSDWTLNVFFEVPDYARRMIWLDGCKYKQEADESDCALIPTAYLDAYFAGSHHSDVDMKYGTQTGSEYFRLNKSSNSKILEIDWQDEDGNGTSDDLTWATSREYLIDQGICTTTQCLEFDRTASIEILWTGLSSEQDAIDMLDMIDNMQLHLSDEARGLPPRLVPEPAALGLFGIGLAALGLAARRRR